MSVAVVDTGTAAYVAAATTQNYTFTVSSGATLAVFYIAQDSTQSITSVTWDQGGTNQACTLVKASTNTTNGAVYIYAVVNPTVGASKTLRIVTGTGVGTAAELQSYSGTVTSSVAAACTNGLAATGSSGTANTAAQSGASGDMYVSGYTTANGITAVSNTQIYILAPAGNDSAANRVASTGTSVTLTATISPSTFWTAVSCDIVASTAVSQPFNQVDFPGAKRVPSKALDTSFALNPNLFKNPIPFNQFDWSKPFRVPQAPIDLSVPLNLQLFKNPIPIFNGDGSLSKIIPDWLPSPAQPYNQNLYVVTVVASPFYQVDIFPIRRLPASPLPDQPYNPNLYPPSIVFTLMGQIWN